MKPIEQQIREKLKGVIDPELNYNIVELGLVYEIKEDKGVAEIKMTFTSPACPVGPAILAAVKNKALEVKGVKEVKTNLTFKPHWTPAMASEEIKLQFQEFL